MCALILGLDCSRFIEPSKIRGDVSLIFNSKFSRTNLGAKCEAFKLPRLKISYRRNVVVQPCCGWTGASFQSGDKDEEQPESPGNSQEEATFNLNLPRRSLSVSFTCDACGARSQRLINRLAYERGLVYVQCSGCSRYHKLVDNLGMVIEYNLQEEMDVDA